MKTTSSTPRFERANQVIKELDLLKFTDKQMRGLSKVEKQFIIEHDYNVALVQNGTIGTNGKLYMFISKNLLGRKQLYAITKKQSIKPNGNDICENGFNYDCWLLFNAKDWGFSKFRYERRFCTAPNVRLIFA